MTWALGPHIKAAVWVFGPHTEVAAWTLGAAHKGGCVGLGVTHRDDGVGIEGCILRPWQCGHSEPHVEVAAAQACLDGQTTFWTML